MIKKYLIIFFVCLINNAFANIRLTIPSDIETKKLNKEQRDRFQNIQYKESVGIPNQYKGKLKYTKGKEEIKLRDVGFVMGVGGRYSITDDITLNSDIGSGSSYTYFNKTNTWEMKNNFNFFVSGGLYWRNGIRIELEYSQMTLETNNYGRNFRNYGSSSVIFNQYLQKTGILTEDSTGSMLTSNMLPVIELKVKTYMLNFILEKTNINSKIRPYLGFGDGIVNGNIDTLKNDESSTVLGAQAMVGLSYLIDDGHAVMYLGYRALFVQDMEQTFTRIVDASSFNGTTYFNPSFVKSKEKYNFPNIHNIDLGIRFFF